MADWISPSTHRPPGAHRGCPEPCHLWSLRCAGCDGSSSAR